MSSFFRTPTSTPYCGVCGGSWPNGHYPDCPILTGEAVHGGLAPQQSQLASQQQLLALERRINLLLQTLEALDTLISAQGERINAIEDKLLL